MGIEILVSTLTRAPTYAVFSKTIANTRYLILTKKEKRGDRYANLTQGIAGQ